MVNRQPMRLLGGHVGDSPDDAAFLGTGKGMRDAEVGDERDVAAHQDVRGFQIAMNDSDFMGGAQARGNVLRDMKRFGYRERPPISKDP